MELYPSALAVTIAASRSRRTSKKLSALTCSSCCRVLMLRAAYPLADKSARDDPDRERSEVAAAAVHPDNDRRVGRRSVLWLPKRGLHLEAIDRLDGKEPQRSAWQRVHVIGEINGCWGGFVFDACCDLRHAYGKSPVPVATKSGFKARRLG